MPHLIPFGTLAPQGQNKYRYRGVVAAAEDAAYTTPMTKLPRIAETLPCNSPLEALRRAKVLKAMILNPEDFPCQDLHQALEQSL